MYVTMRKNMSTLTHFLFAWGFFSTSQLLASTARRIPIELQRLMAEMTLADRTSVTTKRLVNAFGWTDGDMREQHDVQELNRLLFDAIHRSLVGTPGAEMVCDQAHASVLLRLCATSPLVRQSLCIRTTAALTSVCAQHSYRRTHPHTSARTRRVLTPASLATHCAGAIVVQRRVCMVHTLHGLLCEPLGVGARGAFPGHSAECRRR
jgi:hypothetical protein